MPHGLGLFYRSLLLTFLALFIGGCQSTKKLELEGQLNVLRTASLATTNTLDGIRSGKLPPQSDIYLFFSYSAINQALARIDNYSFPAPGKPDIQINIKSVRVSAIGSSPVLNAEASATNGTLSADITLGMILIPESTSSGKPALRMKVLSFSPKVRWWIFEFTKAKFVQSLLAVEANKLTDKMPVIELPVSQELKLGAPESKNRKSIILIGEEPEERATLTLDITTPSTLRQRELTVVNYLFMDKGLHVYGDLK